MHTILVVDDAKDTLMLLAFDLSAEGYKVISAQNGEQALAILKQNTVDLILLDMYMPGLSGLKTLEILKADPAHNKIPVIMLSASNDEDEIVAALELGADDYVTKPYIAKVLLARIKTSIRLMSKSLALEKLAKTDYLTGLNNRGAFEDIANGLINQCRRHQQPLVLCMCDIDLFKQVNDTYGHEAGDKVLVDFAIILKHLCRDYDVVGRIGGEEFAICMPNTEVEHALVACERIRDSVENRAIKLANGDTISITVSIGVTLTTNENVELSELLQRADRCLYHAKANGRNRIDYFAVGEEPALENVEDEHYIEQSTNTADPLWLSALEESQNKSSSCDGEFPGITYEIGVANVLGDDNLFQEILLMFHEDHHLDAKELEHAIETEDILTAKHLAHTLKGVACSIGAMRLYEVAKALDSAINKQETARFTPLFKRVEEELTLVIEGIVNKLL